MNSTNNIKLLLGGVAAGVVADEYIEGRRIRNKLRKSEEDKKKLIEFYYILIQWMRVHHEGRTLVNYFKNNNYKTVAIYGMKELGEALLSELDGTDVEVKYGIDRDADNLYPGIDTYTPDEEIEEVDVIVVCAVHYFDQIEEDMKAKTRAKIVSLEDVVWEA